MLGEEFLYKTPFVNARLNDDEIAVGSLLMGMHEYLKKWKRNLFSGRCAAGYVPLPENGRSNG